MRVWKGKEEGHKVQEGKKGLGGKETNGSPFFFSYHPHLQTKKERNIFDFA